MILNTLSKNKTMSVMKSIFQSASDCLLLWLALPGEGRGWHSWVKALEGHAGGIRSDQIKGLYGQ